MGASNKQQVLTSKLAIDNVPDDFDGTDIIDVFSELHAPISMA